MGQLFTEDERETLRSLTESVKLDIKGDWKDKWDDKHLEALEEFEQSEPPKVEAHLKMLGLVPVTAWLDGRNPPRFVVEFYDPSEDTSLENRYGGPGLDAKVKGVEKKVRAAFSLGRRTIIASEFSHKYMHTVYGFTIPL